MGGESTRHRALILYVVAFVWQLLFLMLIAMGYLLFKNKHRAKAFLTSFLNFEAVLVVEVCPTDHLSTTPHPSLSAAFSFAAVPGAVGHRKRKTRLPARFECCDLCALIGTVI